MAGTLNPNLLLAVPLAPLAGAAIAGLFGTKFFGNMVSRKTSHTVTILGVLIALILLHVTAALRHEVVLKDNTLRRMTPLAMPMSKSASAVSAVMPAAFSNAPTVDSSSANL